MEWISPAEAAELLGISDRRIRQLLNSGQLQGQRIGGRWVVSRADIDRRILSRAVLENFAPAPASPEGSGLEARLAAIELTLKAIEGRLAAIEKQLE